MEYRVTGCEAIRPTVCDVFPIHMELTLLQNREVISGQFKAHDYESYNGFNSDDVAGSVAADGTLAFTASDRAEKLQMQNVSLAVRNGELTGTFEYVWLGQTFFGVTAPVRAFFELTHSNLIPR